MLRSPYLDQRLKSQCEGICDEDFVLCIESCSDNKYTGVPEMANKVCEGDMLMRLPMQKNPRWHTFEPLHCIQSEARNIEMAHFFVQKS